jgi:hypothetical protein
MQIMQIPLSDTLLNVFLAIAVDNLANAQELTAADEADEKANEMYDEESESLEYDDKDLEVGAAAEAELTRELDGWSSAF